MNLYGSILEAIKSDLIAQGEDVASVTSAEDETRWGGYCETCSYEYIAVEVGFVDSKGKNKTYLYDCTFAELIRRLSR
jgi:hypothetical protein